MRDKFFGGSINQWNITQYLLQMGIDEDRATTTSVELESYLDHTGGHLQKEFGDSNDCIILSVATLFSMMLTSEHTSFTSTFSLVLRDALRLHVYSKEKGANKHKIGRLIKRVIFNPKIVNMCKEERSNYDPHKNVKFFTKRFKSCGYSWKTLTSKLRDGIPLVLFIKDDGRGYYQNHCVLVVGCREYNSLDSDKKSCRFLEVYDGWWHHKRFVDYDKLSFWSTIHYVEGKEESLYQL